MYHWVGEVKTLNIHYVLLSMNYFLRRVDIDDLPERINTYQGSLIQPDAKYVVIEGDTWIAISQQFGLTPQRLMSYNNVANPFNIFTGQIINIPPL